MPENTGRLTTALADRYRIESHLGEGGMANVYLAHDLKHDRPVAVKVLRPELAAVLGAERFIQEIKTTANLQHPHILPLFDSGEADSFLYYVMPFIDGETLRDKLNRETQLGIDEAVKITTEVADALDYAHRNNVIHRDIKPENILLHDGRPMVADFGIALAISAAAGGRMTETGMSLGTPHYMSPEQATAEKDLTRRSDIYSLGCVLYEMLTGEPPHVGGSAQAIIMKIVTDEVRPVTELRKSVPPNVAAATAKSLEKLAADRFGTAKEFAEAISNPAFTFPTTAMVKAQSGRLWNRLSVGLATLAAVTTVLFVWSLLRPGPSKPVERHSIRLPSGGVVPSPAGSPFALSPDGSRLVYHGPGEQGRQLWLKEGDQLHATPLPGTDQPYGRPLFAPDGQEVAFFTDRSTVGGCCNAVLKVVSLRGGPPRTVSDSGMMVAAGDWHPDGYLYSGAFFGLRRVVETGGVPEILTTLDTAQGERAHFRPDVLPNGKGVLFTIYREPDNESDIGVLRLATGNVEVLVRGTNAWYAASGHLVFVTADGALLAAPFDQDKLEVTGPAVALLHGVQLGGTLGAFLTLSETGTLVYQIATATELLAEPVWVERDGTVTVIDPEWQINANNPNLALSADGTKLAVSYASSSLRDQDPFSLGVGDPKVWIKQLDTGPLNLLTFEGGDRPAWTPDGQSVTFLSDRAGQFDLYVKRADLTGPAVLLRDDERPILEGFLSRDRRLVYRVGDDDRYGDIYAIRPDVDTAGTALVVTEFAARSATLSPNGRWLAYVSGESERDQVYVVSFPNAADKRLVSTAGGGGVSPCGHTAVGSCSIETVRTTSSRWK